MVVIFSTSLLVMVFFFLLCFVLLCFLVLLFSCFWVFGFLRGMGGGKMRDLVIDNSDHTLSFYFRFISDHFLSQFCQLLHKPILYVISNLSFFSFLLFFWILNLNFEFFWFILQLNTGVNHNGCIGTSMTYWRTVVI